ncbi:MAG: lytic transglycosylase domain-containing protein [Pseudomonadota bacterium]|nr:lytic transglycosylase domain-containing protein [Pseudomonadota bacterium]
MSVSHIRDLNPIEAAIRKAAERTGVDFGFLLKTARRESSLNPTAKAKGSSAAGLFQFVEQTWLGTIKRHGSKHGYGLYSQLIETGKDGRLRCKGDDARKAIMDLRLDPSCSSLMAGELASDHQAYLKGRIGREPTSGELYVAHFLGPKGAARLIEAERKSPGATAASLFPRAAAANKSIFYKKGEPLSVEEVYANLTRTTGASEGAAPARKGPRAPKAGAPEAPEVAYTLLGPGASKSSHALQERLDRMRQEQSLVDKVLNGADGRGKTGLFSAEMLTLFAAAQEEEE